MKNRNCSNHRKVVKNTRRHKSGMEFTISSIKRKTERNVVPTKPT